MEFLNPKKIFDQIPITPGMRVADFGAGAGFFALEVARRIGNTGEVLAIDILETALEAIRSRTSHMGLGNVRTIRSDLEKDRGSTLQPDSCDFVIVSSILFQMENPDALFREAHRILRNSGMLLVIEWIPERMPSTKGLLPVSQDDAKKKAIDAGFTDERKIDAGGYHYAFLFHKTG